MTDQLDEEEGNMEGKLIHSRGLGLTKVNHKGEVFLIFCHHFLQMHFGEAFQVHYH